MHPSGFIFNFIVVISILLAYGLLYAQSRLPKNKSRKKRSGVRLAAQIIAWTLLVWALIATFISIGFCIYGQVGEWLVALIAGGFLLVAGITIFALSKCESSVRDAIEGVGGMFAIFLSVFSFVALFWAILMIFSGPCLPANDSSSNQNQTMEPYAIPPPL